MLKVDNITAGYGRSTVLRGVSLQVGVGECACLVGANGSGKSTLMRVISGLMRPVSGSVTFDGAELLGLTPPDIVSLGVIQVPEGRQLFPKMTVLENLLMGATNKGARNAVQSSFDRVYELFPILAQRKKQMAGTLSGGEQQMLAMARGLMAKPKILMLDEPSIGLSPKFVVEILSVVKGLVKDGISVLLVEQNVRAALTISSHGFLLERGHMTLNGESRQLLENSAVKKGYLGI